MSYAVAKMPYQFSG